MLLLQGTEKGKFQSDRQTKSIRFTLTPKQKIFFGSKIRSGVKMKIIFISFEEIA